jgi:hypothetical protein
MKRLEGTGQRWWGQQCHVYLDNVIERQVNELVAETACRHGQRLSRCDKANINGSAPRPAPHYGFRDVYIVIY